MFYEKIKKILNLKESDDLLTNFIELSKKKQRELRQENRNFENIKNINPKIPILSNFKKIEEFIQRSLKDLNLTFKENNDIYKMMLKIKTKDKYKKSKKSENIKIINNINESLRNNKKQFKMIIDFLKVFFSSLKKTFINKTTKINNSHILNLNLFEEFLSMKNKFKLYQNNYEGKKSKKISCDFNNGSSFSSSRLTFSELRKPISNENYSFLFKDSTNKKKIYNKNSKVSFQHSFLKDENKNHVFNNSASSDMFNSSSNDFLSPNQDKLLKIINPRIKKKQSALSLQKYETDIKKKKNSIENISSSHLNIKRKKIQNFNNLQFLCEKVENYK